VPDVSQTVILTRVEGRVAMPPGEQLAGLAAHGSTLVLFLSITRMFRIARELRAAGYAKDTPVAVVYRVGWPDEQIIRGTLADITPKVRAAKLTLQALILVGRALDPALRQPRSTEQPEVATSHLYSETYTHKYRKARARPAAARAVANGSGS
jgi:precorrin-4/cobalt-precorrin-4 C11-methyltransferase